MLNEVSQDKRREQSAQSEEKWSERLAEVMGRWTGKRWSRALQHARGQSNKRGAVKNQYLLINFPTLLACKSQRNNVCIGTISLPHSISPSKPKALTGREMKSEWKAGRCPNCGKGHRYLQHRLAAILV